MARKPIKGVKVTADKKLSWVTIAGLTDFQDAVGGHIECVELMDGCDLWLNEEGKLIGLPFNSIATDVALPRLQFGDVIVGDVVITGRCDRHGNSTSLLESDGTYHRLRTVAREADGEWVDHVEVQP
jgi:hypothetical protein